MKNKRIIAKLIAVFGISLFILNACSSSQDTESADAVIKKFKQTVKDINAADMSLNALVAGRDNEDNINFSLNADIKADNIGIDRKADVDLKLKGSLMAGGKTMDGNLNIRIQTIGDKFYFYLADFSSSDPGTETIQKALNPYMKKWQHVSQDFIPDSIKKLQHKDEETLKKENQLKDLFISTRIFEVTKEYGVEKINANKVYHFAVKLDKNGVREYMKKAAIINGQDMTEAEVEDAVIFVDSIDNIELWIGAKDYYLYKGVANIVNKNGGENANSEISLTYIAKSYNTDLKITAPSSYEEFNPIALIMGMQLDSMMSDGGMDGGDEDLSFTEDDLSLSEDTVLTDDEALGDMEVADEITE